MLSRPPTGPTAALLLVQSPRPDPVSSVSEDVRLIFVSLGGGRRLELVTQVPGSEPPLVAGEVLTLGGNQLIMRPGGVQSYQAKLTHTGPLSGPPLVTWIRAFGYTRAEL